MRAARGIAVEVIEVVDDGDAVEVTVAYAGRSPEPGLGGEATRALGGRLAAAIADLHATGVTHGAIELDHVLVDTDDAVRLCGFGACAPGDGTADVRALGDVLDALLDPRDRSDDAQAVRAVIERTRADEAPTAAAIAASLASTARPIAASTTTTAPRPASRRRPLVAAAGLVALVVVALLALAATSTDDVAAPPPSTTTTTSAPTTSTTAAARRVWPATPVTVEGAGATWSLGEGDDRALVGAWGCREPATPALVREDGTVWLVAMWADGTTADYVTTVDGEVIDVRVDRVDGCDDLVVTTSTGTVRPLA